MSVNVYFRLIQVLLKSLTLAGQILIIDCLGIAMFPDSLM
ncbi:MAG: hypothetical protein KatS3mg035_1701 [Bacteroidia bacterium]|nr:MAG: hypothetical protein KatS3mg035_1701 [Bacteroidia bacterium]